MEINVLKTEVKHLQTVSETAVKDIKYLYTQLPNKPVKEKEPENKTESSTTQYLLLVNHVTFQKWYIKISFMIKPDFIIKDAIALVDSEADMNCIQEGIVPTRYFEKTTQSLTSASGNSLQIRYKIPEAYICNQDPCLPTSFVLVRNLATNIILGTHFLCLLMPIQKIDQTGIYSQLQGKSVIFEFITQPYTKELDQIRDLVTFKQNQINLLQKEVQFLTTEQRLQQPSLQQKIRLIEKEFQTEICNDVPNAFWERKKHTVTLSYEPDFDEKYIPTRARPSQMKKEYIELCKTEITNLLAKKLIRPSHFP
ncbi:unnamed protein product [Camellia sinensis]